MSDIKQKNESKTYCSEFELSKLISVNIKAVTNVIDKYLPFDDLLFVSGMKRHLYTGLVLVEKHNIIEISEHEIKMELVTVKVTQNSPPFDLNSTYAVAYAPKFDIDALVYDLSDFKALCFEMGVPLKASKVTPTLSYIHAQPLINEISKLKQELKMMQDEKNSTNKDKEFLNIINSDKFPIKLAITLDAYKKFSLEDNPKSSTIQGWINEKSKDMGITHRDGKNEVKGMSNKQLEVLASVVAS